MTSPDPTNTMINRHLLVVVQDSALVDHLTPQLQPFGHVHIAHDLDIAYQIMMQYTVQIIIADQVITSLFDRDRDAFKHPSPDSIRVLFIIDNEQMENINTIHDSHTVAYLTIPLQPEIVTAHVQSAYAQHGHLLREQQHIWRLQQENATLRQQVSDQRIELSQYGDSDPSTNDTEEFIHTVTHDLRGPVGNIKLLAGFASDPDTEPQDRNEFMSLIIESCDKLLARLDALQS